MKALYACFSTDLQRAASIEDQFRNCRKRAELEGWTSASSYALAIELRIETTAGTAERCGLERNKAQMGVDRRGGRMASAGDEVGSTLVGGAPWGNLTAPWVGPSLFGMSACRPCALGNRVSMASTNEKFARCFLIVVPGNARLCT